MLEERDPALDPALDQPTRRTFIGRLGAGTAVAVLSDGVGASQPTPQALHDPALKHEEVRFKSGGHQIDAFVCRPPTGARRAGVIVVHEIFGLTDHIRDIACRLARAGYTGMAVNLFTREGTPPPMDAGFDKLMAFVGRIPDSQVVGDLNAAARYLRGRRDSSGKVGLVGFCWGGYYALLSAAEVKPLDAAVAYYGRIRLSETSPAKPRSPMDLAPQMKAPLMGHFGALDRSIPPADAEALREELRRRGRPAEIYVYEGAGHAFNNDTRESYNAAAAKLAWQRTLDWFSRYLGSGSDRADAGQ